MVSDNKKLLRLAISSVTVVIVVLIILIVCLRVVAMFRIATASASEQTVKLGQRTLPVFIFEPAADSITPAQIAMDYQLQMNLFILRNGFLTGTPALTACVENACKCAYTLAQLKSGLTSNTHSGRHVSLLRSLAPFPGSEEVDDDDNDENRWSRKRL